MLAAESAGAVPVARGVVDVEAHAPFLTSDSTRWVPVPVPTETPQECVCAALSGFPSVALGLTGQAATDALLARFPEPLGSRG